MNRNMRVRAVERVGRYVACVSLALGAAVGAAGIASAGPTTTNQGAERPAICKVVGGVPLVASIAGCTTGIPGIPGLPGHPPTVTTVPVER